MKKIILVIFLALMALAQVYAQDSGLRAAPDLPTFKVTLNYSSMDEAQGTIVSSVASGSKVAYNSQPVFTITAKPGYVLSDIRANTATIGTLPTGTFKAEDNTTTYSYTSAALTGSTEIKAVFKAKDKIKISATPLTATKDEVKAGVNLPVITLDPVVTGHEIKYRSSTGAVSDRLPAEVGTYTILVNRPETATQATVKSEFSFVVTAPHTLSYSFDGTQGSVTTSMGGSPIASGGEIAYGKPAVLRITSKSGYVLSGLTVDNKGVTLPKGTFKPSTNETSYADYTTSALTASTVIDVRFAPKKTVSVTASPLSATKDEIQAGKNLPVITFTPNTIAGQKVQYKNATGALSDKLPVADGVYTIVATSPETAEYAALKDENMRFTVSKANVLNYNVESAGQGTVTAKMGSTDMASGSEILNGQPAVFTIIANAGFLLNKIVVNGVAVSALPKGVLNKDNTISYIYTTASLTASTTLSVGFAAKKTISVDVTGSSATKDEIVAGKNLPVIKFTPEITGQAVQYRAADGSETSTLPRVAGTYKIVLFSPETMEYAALVDSSKAFTILNANALAYAVDGGHGTVTAKMGGKDILNNGDIIYNSPVVFTILSDANYKLGGIKSGAADIDSKDIKGTYANGHTTYTYTTGNLTASASYTFSFVPKDTVRFVANNLVQIVGSVKPVSYSSEKKDLKVQYLMNGSWVAELPSSLAVGSYQVRFTRPEDLEYCALSETATLVVESKKEVESLVLPTPGRIEEGQALSASTLIGGTPSGSFIWKDPNEIASPEKKMYDLTFEPNDPVRYAAKDTFITLDVIPVYTMRVTAGNFGSVILEGRAANDKYASGSVLRATAVADKNYQFVSWSDGNTSAIRELRADANLDIEARFDPVLYGVTLTNPTNGSLRVFANGVEVKSGTEFLQGTLLTITATPDAGYMVQSVKVNDALVNNGSYALTRAAHITADFVEKEATKHLVKVGDLRNGSVSLIVADSKAPVTPGEAISEGMKVKVIGTADYGYELVTVKVEGANYNETDSSFTVGTGDVTVNASFQLVEYQISSALNIPGAGKVLLKDKAGKEVTSGSKVSYTTQLTASVETGAGYRFINMMVNSSEIKDGGEFTVSGPMTITANYVEKKDLSPLIDQTPQTLVYNKQYRNFEVKITGYSGLDFKVSYSQNGVLMTENPKSAGTYNVRITRDEDDLFKAVDVTARLVITKAGMALLEVPTLMDDHYSEIDAKLTQDFASVEWNPTTQRSALRASVAGTPEQDRVNILRFTPLDANNYEPVDYSMPVGEVSPVTLTAPDTEVTNGGLTVGDYSSIPKNTVLRLRAIAPGEDQRFTSWSGDVPDADKKKPEITVTLSADATYTPIFEAKPKMTANTSDLELVYNGSVQFVELKNILSGTYPEDVNIKYTNTDGSVATPLNAGTYLVIASRTGDDNWRSFEATKKLVIKKAKVGAVIAPTASPITEGQSLSESVLSGGVAKAADGTTISGKFEWADPSAILKPGDGQEKDVIFTSYDSNYEDATTKAKVTVKSSDALIITFTQPENGSLKVYTANGEGEKTEITSGTAVAKATKLTVEAEPDAGYELAGIQVGEKNHTTSPVEIEVDKSLAIIAEFKQVSTPPGTNVPVTGVSLDITSKTLAVGESFALQAKVAPSNATMRTVSWSSSDETVATVDADGVVTALKIGTCRITVATDDGNKTASCVVSVSGTVSIEQILKEYQVYCERGAIVVNPSRPVTIRIFAVTGINVYDRSIAGSTRIPVSTGVYLVEIIEHGKHLTVKLNVR